MSVVLSGNDLTFSQLYDVALRGETVSLAPAAIERMNASRAVVERLVASGATAYGINTGFGKLASVRISTEQVRQLQFVRGSVREPTEMVDDLLNLAKVDAGRISISPEWFMPSSKTP